MNKPVAIAAVAALSATLLAACGNKGPLVRPSDIPPPPEAVPAEAVPAPAIDGATLPDTTPPAQPPVTDVVAPPPAQGDGD